MFFWKATEKRIEKVCYYYIGEEEQYRQFYFNEASKEIIESDGVEVSEATDLADRTPSRQQTAKQLRSC